MWELDHQESWALKNWCFWTVMLEKTLESPLDSKDIKPVSPKGNQSWLFIGRTDTEAKTPKLWPSDAKNWLIGKDPVAWKDWKQVEKGTTEDEMVGWYHQLNGHEFEQALGDGEIQGSLECCTPRIHSESDMTEQVNNNKNPNPVKIDSTINRVFVCLFLYLFLSKLYTVSLLIAGLLSVSFCCWFWCWCNEHGIWPWIFSSYHLPSL